MINGIDANDSAGIAVSHAGDINGDGRDDVLVAALSLEDSGTDNIDAVYVIYGNQNAFTSSIDLSSLEMC